MILYLTLKLLRLLSMVLGRPTSEYWPWRAIPWSNKPPIILIMVRAWVQLRLEVRKSHYSTPERHALTLWCNPHTTLLPWKWHTPVLLIWSALEIKVPI